MSKKAVCLGSVLWLIGNSVFAILCFRLKNNPDEYLALLKMHKDGGNYTNLCGFDCMTFSECFKGKTDEEKLMLNCPNIMIERPWKKYLSTPMVVV